MRKLWNWLMSEPTKGLLGWCNRHFEGIVEAIWLGVLWFLILVLLNADLK